MYVFARLVFPWKFTRFLCVWPSFDLQNGFIPKAIVTASLVAESFKLCQYSTRARIHAQSIWIILNMIHQKISFAFNIFTWILTILFPYLKSKIRKVMNILITILFVWFVWSRVQTFWPSWIPIWRLKQYAKVPASWSFYFPLIRRTHTEE